MALSTSLSKAHDLSPILAKCERNVNVGLESYNTFAVPSFENLLALTMGVGNADRGLGDRKLTVLCPDDKSAGRTKAVAVRHSHIGRGQSMPKAWLPPREYIPKRRNWEERPHAAAVLDCIRLRQEHVAPPGAIIPSTRFRNRRATSRFVR
jgi:hypothetical protein